MKSVYLLLVIFLAGCAGQVPQDEHKKEQETETLVYIDNNAVQCESDGFSPDETAQVLRDNGISVSESFCGYLTGVVVAAVCGMGNSAINLHRIDNGDVVAAGELGFVPVSLLEIAEDKGYMEADCP